jgi:hypothetical protein
MCVIRAQTDRRWKNKWECHRIWATVMRAVWAVYGRRGGSRRGFEVTVYQNRVRREVTIYGNSPRENGIDHYRQL